LLINCSSIAEATDVSHLTLLKGVQTGTVSSSLPVLSPVNVPNLGTGGITRCLYLLNQSVLATCCFLRFKI
jgi:hypothetical protein